MNTWRTGPRNWKIVEFKDGSKTLLTIKHFLPALFARVEELFVV